MFHLLWLHHQHPSEPKISPSEKLQTEVSFSFITFNNILFFNYYFVSGPWEGPICWRCKQKVPKFLTLLPTWSQLRSQEVQDWCRGCVPRCQLHPQDRCRNYGQDWAPGVQLYPQDIWRNCAQFFLSWTNFVLRVFWTMFKTFKRMNLQVHL